MVAGLCLAASSTATSLGPIRAGQEAEGVEIQVPEAIVLVMSDDQGFGDVGRRDPSLSTPHLDGLLQSGVEFQRFYAAAPVCSPTRASVLTGRHPARMGIDGANDGHLPPDEVHLAEVLRASGYRTGFFGKWHLGTLTQDVRDSNRGGRPAEREHYAPPWDHGFDVVFATEAKVPTFDPMRQPGGAEPFGTRYWTGPGEVVPDEVLEGDDSKLIVDRALAFVKDCTERGVPSLAVVWLHAPHEPVTRSPLRLAALELDPESARDRYVACLADVDEQVGALRSALEERGRGVLWFCSDNGPEHPLGPGSTGGLRGRKRDLLEGGIRVPAALWWCGLDVAGVEPGVPFAGPAGTIDILPTLLELVGSPVSLSGLDGASLLPRLAGEEAAVGYGFRSKKQRAWIGPRWKIYSSDEGGSWQLFDLHADPGEALDRAGDSPEIVARHVALFRAWEAAVLLDRAR